MSIFGLQYTHTAIQGIHPQNWIMHTHDLVNSFIPVELTCSHFVENQRNQTMEGTPDLENNYAVFCFADESAR